MSIETVRVYSLISCSPDGADIMLCLISPCVCPLLYSMVCTHCTHCTLYSIHSIAVQSWKHHPSSLEMQNSTNEQIICNQQNRCNTSAFYWNGKHSDGRLFEWNIYDDLIMEMLFITLNAGAQCWCCEGWRRLNSIDWLWLPLRTERYITPMNINK